MILALLALLPQSALLYIANFFFIYSIIFSRAEHQFLAGFSMSIFDTVTDIYAEKSLTQKINK